MEFAFSLFSLFLYVFLFFVTQNKTFCLDMYTDVLVLFHLL